AVEVRSKLEMYSQRADRHRSAIAIVGGVDDFLKVPGHVDAFYHGQVIEDLHDLLWSVIQGAVADDEIQAAGSQVFVVHLGEAVGIECETDLVVWPTPASALEEQAHFRQAVDRGESPRFRVSVV